MMSFPCRLSTSVAYNLATGNPDMDPRLHEDDRKEDELIIFIKLYIINFSPIYNYNLGHVRERCSKMSLIEGERP